MLPPAALEVTRHNLLQFVATGCRTAGRTLLTRCSDVARYAPTNSSNTARNRVLIETQIPEDRSCLRTLAAVSATPAVAKQGQLKPDQIVADDLVPRQPDLQSTRRH